MNTAGDGGLEEDEKGAWRKGRLASVVSQPVGFSDPSKDEEFAWSNGLGRCLAWLWKVQIASLRSRHYNRTTMQALL